ncbi:glycoside hydrolase family 15 protein [Sphaerisporangium sp. NPDC051011]|uniref:glycoside hydrolase family 15 protein n=1 Tax=Sphaerisporangium sp. NPDC051011 TaxID=3155792 RepID=UPI0033D64703
MPRPAPWALPSVDWLCLPRFDSDSCFAALLGAGCRPVAAGPGQGRDVHAPAPARLGRREESRRLFERLLSLRNDLGLISEEYDVTDRRQLGDFPQAYSHVALINTAATISAQE